MSKVGGIGGATKVVAIFGDPVSHSRSPAMHNAAFAELGLDWAYVALRVDPVDLRGAVAGVRAMNFAGLNVTVPHKEKIARYLDELSERAESIGAVNTVVRRGDALVGDNTDAEGFRRAVEELGFRGRGKRVLVLGAGGSARAVVWALAQRRVASITVLNRTLPRARKLAAFARSLGVGECAAGPLEANRCRDEAQGCDLVVNCTSLGLAGRGRPPVDPRDTPQGCVFYDLVYAAKGTPFVERARDAGRPAADGRRMLIHQAALAFHIWTARRAPIDTLASAF